MTLQVTTAFAKDAFYQVVGEALRAMREALGMSQGGLAAEAGCHLTTVQNAESGHTCSLMMLAKFAHALDCSLDELVPLEALT